MIIIREKSFGKVKKENKAKKKLWEENMGNKSLDKFDSGREFIIEENKKDILKSRVRSNGFNITKAESLPEIKNSESLRKLGRNYLLEDFPEDSLDRKKKTIGYFGAESYYKNKLKRFKFDKDKLTLRNEEDLLDKYIRPGQTKKDIVEEISSSKSIPVSKKFKRFFKKNLNKLIK